MNTNFNMYIDEPVNIEYDLIGIDDFLDIIIDFIDVEGIQRKMKCPSSSPTKIIHSIGALSIVGLHTIELGKYDNNSSLNLRLLNEEFMDIDLFPSLITLGKFDRQNKEELSKKIYQILVENLIYLKDKTKEIGLPYQYSNKLKYDLDILFNLDTIQPLHLGGTIEFRPSPFRLKLSPYEYLSAIEEFAESYFSMVSYDDNIKESSIYMKYLDNVEKFKQSMNDIKSKREAYHNG